jgi:hypothetical protein
MPGRQRSARGQKQHHQQRQRGVKRVRSERKAGPTPQKPNPLVDSKALAAAEKRLLECYFVSLKLKKPVEDAPAVGCESESESSEDGASGRGARKKRAACKKGNIPWPVRLDKGKYKLAQEDFKIPYKMFYDWASDEYTQIKREIAGPSRFTPVTQNIYNRRSLQVAAQHKSQTEQCSCVYDKRRGMACGSTCLNRVNLMECSKTTCPCFKAAQRCDNMRFTNEETKKLSVKFLGRIGFALILDEPVRKGDFILQYVGEILDDRDCALRLKKYTKKHAKKSVHTNHYILSMGDDLNIDATMKGCVGRFINHSCEPNCESLKWDVEGKPCMGVFALRDLPAGTPVTFDYKFRRFGSELQECYCGTPSCRIFLGAKKKVLKRDSSFSSSPSSSFSSSSSDSDTSGSEDNSSGSGSEVADSDSEECGDGASSDAEGENSHSNLQKRMEHLMQDGPEALLVDKEIARHAFLARNVRVAHAARKAQLARLCEVAFKGNEMYEQYQRKLRE